MMYTRAQGCDYDSWKTEGWSQKDLLPLLKKLETYHPKDPAIDQTLHGHDGPIHISDGGYRAKDPEDEFIKVIKAMGEKEIVDLQDLKQVGGYSVSIWPLFVPGTITEACSAGLVTFPQTASVKMPPTATSTPFFKMATIPICTCSSRPKSSASSSTNRHLHTPSVSNTSPTKTISPLSPSAKPRSRLSKRTSSS